VVDRRWKRDKTGRTVEVDITNRWSSSPGDKGVVTRTGSWWRWIGVLSVHQLKEDVEDGDAGGGLTSSPLQRKWIDPLH